MYSWRFARNRQVRKTSHRVLYSMPLRALCTLATKWTHESRARKSRPTTAHKPNPPPTHPTLSYRLQVNGVFLGPHSIKLYIRIIYEYVAKIAKDAAVAYPKYYPALAWRKWGNSSKASIRTANAPAEIRTGTSRTEVHSVSWKVQLYLQRFPKYKKMQLCLYTCDTCTLPLF